VVFPPRCAPQVASPNFFPQGVSPRVSPRRFSQVFPQWCLRGGVCLSISPRFFPRGISHRGVQSGCSTRDVPSGGPPLGSLRLYSRGVPIDGPTWRVLTWFTQWGLPCCFRHWGSPKRVPFFGFPKNVPQCGSPKGFPPMDFRKVFLIIFPQCRSPCLIPKVFFRGVVPEEYSPKVVPEHFPLLFPYLCPHAFLRVPPWFFPLIFSTWRPATCSIKVPAPEGLFFPALCFPMVFPQLVSPVCSPIIVRYSVPLVPSDLSVCFTSCLFRFVVHRCFLCVFPLQSSLLYSLIFGLV
jgi:hypothetical protein